MNPLRSSPPARHRRAGGTLPRSRGRSSSSRLDNLKFSATTIEARPGETLRIVVQTSGQMPKIAMADNSVLLQPGTDPAASPTKGRMHRGSDFIAPAWPAGSSKTLMAGAGETVEVERRLRRARAAIRSCARSRAMRVAGMAGNWSCGSANSHRSARERARAAPPQRRRQARHHPAAPSTSATTT